MNPVPEALRDTPWAQHASRLRDALAALAAGPEPEASAARLARVLHSAPGVAARSTGDTLLAARLVAVCGSGRALPAMCASLGDESLHALLAGGIAPARIAIDPDDPVRSLRRSVATGVLSIAALDLTRAVDMPAVGAGLADLADAAAAAALSAASRGTVRVAIIALGKWGGRELNYASDIDLVFVHEGDAEEARTVAAGFIDLMSQRTADGLAFRVDADLRPEGAAGPLTRTIESYHAYWTQWAHTWELQALLKARVATGDPELGRRFLEAAEEHVHPETLGAEAVREIRAMKARTERLVAGSDELKRGVGGIRDIEFAVQLLQLVHGRADPELRSTNTLTALDLLGTGGYVDPEDAGNLADAYRWLRDVEHRLQLQDLRQTHSLPADTAGRERVAKAMGYRDDASGAAGQRFEADLLRRRTLVRSIHERLFYRPLLEAFAATDARADRQLAALGFSDTAATRAALSELTAGLSRRSRLMQQLLPLMMEWLAATPDPDLGLTQLRLLVGDDADQTLVGALRDNPAAAERLCLLLGTARTAGRLVDRIPGSLATMGNDAALGRPPDAASLATAALARAGLRADPRGRIDTLHRFWAERLLETITADVAGIIDATAVGRRLSAAADALVQGLLEAARDQVADQGHDPPPLAVIALGKWGGSELNYASDLDAMVVFEGDETAAVRVAELLVASLATSSLGLPPPHLDLDLRPEGRKGALARSLDAYRAYWERWALTWEHQALTRTRGAAGDSALAARFIEAASASSYPERLGDEAVRSIRAMKARIERERIPIGEDPDFHVKLGRGTLADIEWTVQLLQMRHGHSMPGLRTPSTLDALAALAAGGVLGTEDAAVLDEAYRFCATLRNRLFLRAGRPRDSLPTDPIEAAAVARSLGYDLAPRTRLREEYHRVTRRARRVVERVLFSD